MPQAIAMAASWVAMGAFQAASAVGLSVTAAATIAQVATAATYVAATVGANALVTAATAPKLSSQPFQTELLIDPQGPLTYAIGRTAVGGSVIHQTTTGESGKYLNWYASVSAGGPHEGFETFLGNGAAMTFGADSGEGASGYFQNRVWLKRVLNGGAAAYGGLRFTATGSKDTPANHGGNAAEWTAAHKATDHAMFLLAQEYDVAKFSGGPLKPLNVFKGAKVYDPRFDSTYPGGSGPQRWADPADATAFAAARETWVWSENPYIHALNWCLGRWSRNGSNPFRRVLGVGAPISMIKVAQFVEGANVADANGWKVGGQITTRDGKWDPLSAMLQAGGGAPLRVGGMIGCTVAAPRVSIATLTADDLADGDVVIPGTQARRDRINRVIARYRSEAHAWEIVAAAPVVVDTYVTADGGWRTKEIDFPLVQDVNQVAQLAALHIVKAREFGPGQLSLKPRWMGLEPGDCVTLNIPVAGLASRKVQIHSRNLDVATAARTVTFMSETDEGYAYVTGRSGTPPPIPSLGGTGAVPPAPTIDEWVATGATLTDNGVSVPAIVIAGATTNPNNADLLARYRPAGAVEWIGPVIHALDYDIEHRIELAAGLTSETTYSVQIAYRSIRGVWSEWTTLDDVVAGSFAFDTMGTTDGLLTVYYQATAPAAPERGDVWFDTDAGNAPFQWDGTAWVDAANNAAVQAIQFATSAQSTANSKVKVFYQTSAPTAETIGDLWVDTDDGNRRVFRWSGSSWQQIADQTGFNIAAGISGQGSLATQNWVVWATQVTGVGRPEDYANRSIVYRQMSAPSSPSTNDIWVQLNGSGVAIAMWAYNGSVWINGADRTIYNIAAGISGQGTLATQNQVTTSLIAPNAVSRVAYGEASGRMSFTTTASQHFAMSYTSNGGAHVVHVVAEAGVDSWDPDAGASAILYCNGVPLKGASMKIPAGWGQDSRSFLATHTPGPGGCYYTVSYQASPGSGAVHANNTSVMVLELQR